MKSGFVAVIGRPNVGKSTLVNTMVGSKVAIVTNKPQTTRNNIQGIYHDEEAQIIFIDTPGIHKPKYKLGTFLNRQAYNSLNEVDAILFLVDGSSKLGKGDNFVLEKLKDINTPVILVINKIDKLKKDEIIVKIQEYKDLYNFKEIIPLSALKKDNIKELINILKPLLTDNIKYYEDNQITDKSLTFQISEIIREKVFNETDEEVPHALTVIVENIEKSKDSLVINASIVVDRDSLKKIIIGKQGTKIKQIGIESRKELETLLNKKIYLDLFVKTIKKWRDKEKYLSEFGYTDFE